MIGKSKLNNDAFAARELLERYGIPATTFTIVNTILMFEFDRIKRGDDPLHDVQYIFGGMNFLRMQDESHTNILVRNNVGEVVDMNEFGLEKESGYDATFYQSVIAEFEKDEFTSDEVRYLVEDMLFTMKARHQKDWFENIQVGDWMEIHWTALKDIENGDWDTSNFYKLSDADEEGRFSKISKNRQKLQQWHGVNLVLVILATVSGFIWPPLSFWFAMVWGSFYLSTVNESLTDVLKTGNQYKIKTHLQTLVPLIGSLGTFAIYPPTGFVFVSIVVCQALSRKDAIDII